MTLNLRFGHGLGDCANFAHILELYRRRGYEINLHCSPDKQAVFAPLGAALVPADYPGLQDVYYPEFREPDAETADQYWSYNKIAGNLSRFPLPDIGSPEDLWEELCSVRLNVNPHIGAEARSEAQAFLRPLARPIVLIHSMGNTTQGLKNIPCDTALELYIQLLDRCAGTIILLDWDNRVPRLAGWRVRHLTDDWKAIDLQRLLALMQQSDLLLSIDSGPLHLARMTDIPIVGVFAEPGNVPGQNDAAASANCLCCSA